MTKKKYASLSYGKSISVKVIPHANRTEILGFLEDGTLRVTLRSHPEWGKANEELLDLLRSETGISWEIIRGKTSSRKILRTRSLSS